MGVFAWLFRSAEKERAYARLTGLKEQYGNLGGRVIRLSARTEIARKSAGSTLRAFDFVERAFADATGAYAAVAERIEVLEAGLAKGRVGDFQAIDTALAAVATKLDELQTHLTAWEARWQEVPLRIDAARDQLAELTLQVRTAADTVGAPLPLTERLAAMTAHLAKAERTLAEGNPAEADHLLADLAIAMQKVSAEAGTYLSGAGAILDAEQEVNAAKSRLGAETPADAVAAVAAAEALLSRLRPALAAGKLAQFQEDLLQIRRQLVAVH